MQSTLSSRSSLLPLPFASPLAGNVVFCVAASVFVAICARISYPLGFTPVPTTLANLAVILVGMVLGPRVGAAALLLYLAEGAAGLPVFSPHGLGGVAQLLGPTGGFLASYPIAAAVAGSAVRRWPVGGRRFLSGLQAAALASVPIFLLGAGWLSTLHHLSISASVRLAVLPFLPGEALKIILAAGAFSAISRWTRG